MTNTTVGPETQSGTSREIRLPVFVVVRILLSLWYTVMLQILRHISGKSALLVGRSRDRFPVVSLGIFSVVPPTEPCSLRSTQPPKVSTSDFFWGKGGWCVWLTNYHPCSAETSRKSGALIYPEPIGHLGLLRDTFTFLLTVANSPVGLV